MNEEKNVMYFECIFEFEGTFEEALKYIRKYLPVKPFHLMSLKGYDAKREEKKQALLEDFSDFMHKLAGL